MLSGSQRGVRLLPPGLSVALAMLGALLLSAYGYRHRLLVAIRVLGEIPSCCGSWAVTRCWESAWRP